MVKGEVYRFNIINCEKTDSQFNYGMQPVVYSEREAGEGRPGWSRAGSMITYYKNNFYTEGEGEGGKEGRGSGRKGEGKRLCCCFTLSFSLSFPHSNDNCYVAYHYPYSFSMLMVSCLQESLCFDSLMCVCHTRVVCIMCVCSLT